MANKKYIISCPHCGRELFKSSRTDTVIKCNKCGAEISIEINDNQIVFCTKDLAVAESQTAYNVKNKK